MGMNPDPGQSYGLLDRFICGICGARPDLVKSSNEFPITLSVRCCGKTHTGTYTRQQLTFTQVVFDKGQTESDD